MRRAPPAECPKKHTRELQTVFKGLDISGEQPSAQLPPLCSRLAKRRRTTIAVLNEPCLLADLLVVPTCQRSDMDLVRVGDVIEDEKDRLLEKARRETSALGLTMVATAFPDFR